MADYPFEYGKSVTITATPADGYEVTAMTANSETVANPYTVTITENIAIEVTTEAAATPAKASTKAKK